MTRIESRCARRPRLPVLLAATVLASLSTGVAAQDNSGAGSTDYLDRLKACRLLTDDTARLACFDRAVGEIVSATEDGEVQLIDREDVRQTKRELFGFSVPDVGILKSDNEADKQASDTLETSITSVRYLTRSKFRFTTAEGAVWEINNAPARLRSVEAGDKVVFKKASFGYYFVRINDQLGVKGKRVE
jgi:hypothetical protein